jgi:hypothetical protein
MNRLFRLAVRLYPSSWRQRYAREFEALLEDVQPGWRELIDVISGALTMQIKTLGAIPVLCALAGAIVGGIVALRTPEVFASSATIGLKARDMANRESATVQELRVSLEKALGASSGTREATSVTLHRDDSAQITLLKLTYLDRDPAQAQRVAEQLIAAIATQNSERAGSIEVLDAPDLPRSPIRPDYPITVASGGGAGLVAGGVALLLLRSRRRPATVA